MYRSFSVTKVHCSDAAMLDDSLFGRPPIQIGQPEKLLLLPDAEFQRYDAEQRSNLVFRAATKAANPSAPATPVPK